MSTKQIFVRSCATCPLAEYDRKWALYSCKHPDGPRYEMPEDTIHPDCPLRKEAVVVSIDEPQQPNQ